MVVHCSPVFGNINALKTSRSTRQERGLRGFTVTLYMGVTPNPGRKLIPVFTHQLRKQTRRGAKNPDLVVENPSCSNTGCIRLSSRSSRLSRTPSLHPICSIRSCWIHQCNCDVTMPGVWPWLVQLRYHIWKVHTTHTHRLQDWSVHANIHWRESRY